MPDVRLTVNGREYAGWTDVIITRGIEAIAGTFSLKVSDRWQEATPWPIAPEDECTVAVDRTTLITGYVDSRVLGLQTGGHSLQVSGRDKAAALVDNSAVLSHWEFSNIGVLEFCQKVAAPFGVGVSLQDGITDIAISTTPRGVRSKGRAGGAPTSVGSAGKSSSMTIGKPIAQLKINPGESAFEAIEDACRMAGVLAVSDGFGNIVLTRGGGRLRATTELVEGQNILSAEATFDATKRYRTYIVSGQSQGSDETSGLAAASVKGTAEDAGVTRAARVLLIRPERGCTLAFARQRAAWEATVRKARAMTATVTVQGWTQSAGALWPINTLVGVRCPRLGLADDMLITEATYRISSESGTTTELKVVDKDAFIPEPVLKPSGRGSGLRFD